MPKRLKMRPSSMPPPRPPPPPKPKPPPPSRYSTLSLVRRSPKRMASSPSRVAMRHRQQRLHPRHLHLRGKGAHGAAMADTTSRRRAKTSERLPLPDEVALVLQGGGALGAYQAGVIEGLEEKGIEIDWVA